MSAGTAPRRSRFWLFAPPALLALLAAALAAAWFVIRARTGDALDAFVANEAAAGRRWDCPERAIAGFPFRIEVSCARLAIEGPEGAIAAGRLRTVTQIYQPRHTIFELDGPFRAASGGVAAEGSWDALRGSVHTAANGLERVSLVLSAPKLRVTGLPAGEAMLSARSVEAHVRPDPAGADAIDLAATIAGAAVPPLDQLLGGPEPIDADLQIRVTQARAGLRPSRSEIERWREAGGRIGLTSLTTAKGARRLEAKGELGLDELRRPMGRLEVAAAGLGDLLGTLMGGRLPGAPGGVLGGLLGPRLQQNLGGGSAKDPGKLTPLPAIRIENGRIHIGPVTVPGVRLMPLY
ncbi:MAG: DUF2125 domain-containing protein [Microvirga sp.]